MLALEGKQLGNYDVIRRIRVGGMGAVYEGKQRTAFGRRVAIKVILGDYAADKDMRRRFAREARIVAQLHHPHILPLIEFGDEQGILYLVMPFIDGGTLTGYLRKSQPGWQEGAEIFLQLLEAVEYAHEQGLIHRDIKSSNVLMEQRRNTTPHIYLADFGLVRSAQSAIAQKGTTIPLDQVPGTPHYMAPEQTHGIVTPLTDIYAMGVLLFQILTGELPYDDQDEIQVIQMQLHAPIPAPTDVDPTLPTVFNEIIQVAMAKQPEERYQSVAELRRAFLTALRSTNATDLFLDEVQERETRPSAYPTAIQLTAREQQTPASPQYANAGAAARKRKVAESIPARPVLKSIAPRRNRRFSVITALLTLVILVLLTLLIVPRVWGVSLFPAGFPVFGTDAIATVTVTPQSSMLQDTYQIIASPALTAPDPTNAHNIPDRIVKGKDSATQTVNTTGSKTYDGVAATGKILFTNSGTTAITVAVGQSLTSTTGVVVQITQAVQVPPQQSSTNGTASAPAIAANPGSAGNIQANAISTTCCNGLTATNPAPFTGGVDARTARIVAQSDLDSVRNSLYKGLQSSVYQQIQGQLAANEVLAGDPVYNTIMASDSPVGTEVNSVTVSVTVSASVSVYNKEIAQHAATRLLNDKATSTLGPSYKVQGNLVVDPPHLLQTDVDGVVDLTVGVHGLWVYAITSSQLTQWLQAIKGATPTLATTYLKSQTGIASVQINLPYGTDHLPTATDHIKLVVGSP